jgi:DNA polymerase III delta subunit
MDALSNLDVEIVVIEGDEPEKVFLRDSLIEEFSKKIDGASRDRSAGDELAVETFEGEEALERGLNAVATPSLIGASRVVLVKTASLSKAAIDRLSRARTQTHEHGADSASTTRALLVIELERKVPPAQRKALADAGIAVKTAKEPSLRELSEVLTLEARRKGIELSAEAATYLIGSVGSDRGALRAALAQLEDWVLGSSSAEGKLRREAVEKLFEPHRHDPPWVVIAAIEKGKADEALMSVRGLLEGGYHPLQVLSLIYTSLRRAAYLAGSWERHRELLASMNVPPAAKSRISSLAKRLGPVGAHRVIAEIAEAELEMKGSSGLDPVSVLERLVVRLCELCRDAT